MNYLKKKNSANKLETLPSSIRTLSHLKELFLDRNNLTNKSFINLPLPKDLLVLFLSSNNLSFIPTSIFDCSGFVFFF